ncbi:MAG: ATP-binding protein [Nitrospirae bacterium]|nr:ATP-binding protein [Nitrospirota bacterium]
MLSEYSSKIKNIFIELHDYSFFHSPSGSTHRDDRFIGRTRIIERLRNILSNTNIKSGSYLITGYRGMGKSSFVSEAISELKCSRNPSNIYLYYRKTILVLILMSFLKIGYVYIMFTFNFILLFCFMFGDVIIDYFTRDKNQKKSIEIGYVKVFKSSIKRLIDTFNINKRITTTNKFVKKSSFFICFDFNTFIFKIYYVLYLGRFYF